MTRLRLLITLVVAVAVGSLPAAASAAMTPIHVHFKPIKQGSATPSPDGRYVYLTTSGGGLLHGRGSLLDTQTGRSVLLPSPPHCGSFSNAVGDTNVLAVCGTVGGKQTGWVLSIATRQWRQLPSAALGDCGDGSGTSHRCEAESVGRTWTDVLEPQDFTNGQSFTPRFWLYDLGTGRVVSAANGTDWLFGAGGGQLNLDRQHLVTRATPCQPLTDEDLWGWVGGTDYALQNGRNLYLQRCNSRHRRRLSTSESADPGTAAGPLVVWATCGSCVEGTGVVHGYDITRRRFFAVAEPSGVSDSAPMTAGRYLFVSGYAVGPTGALALYEARLPSSA